HGGLWISTLVFRRLIGGVFLGPPALVQNLDIADLHVFDQVARNPADNRAQPGDAIRAHQVADDHPLQGSHRRVIGTAHAVAQPQEDRRTDDIAHRNVGDGDVFEDGPVHRLQRQPLAAFEDAIGNRDVAEPAVGFGAELDAAGVGNADLWPELLVSAVQHRPFFPAAADVAVGDGDVLGLLGAAQCVIGLQTNAVVPGRVHVAIRNADVAAGIHVHAVAVSIDLQIIDRQIVYSRRQNAEVAAVENRKIAQQHVVTVLQADGFVAHSRNVGIRALAGTAAQTFTPDTARSDDGDVFDLFAPEQAVAEMAVAEILVHVPLIGLGEI